MERSSDRSGGGNNCDSGQIPCRTADLQSAAVTKEPDTMNVLAFRLGKACSGLQIRAPNRWVVHPF